MTTLTRGDAPSSIAPNPFPGCDFSTVTNVTIRAAIGQAGTQRFGAPVGLPDYGVLTTSPKRRARAALTVIWMTRLSSVRAATTSDEYGQAHGGDDLGGAPGVPYPEPQRHLRRERDGGDARADHRFVSWTVAMLACVAVVNVLIFRR